MKRVETPLAPKPAGHYAQAVVHGGLVFVAGQLPIDPQRPGVIPEGIEAQTERAMGNVAAILQAAGSGLPRLLSVTVYLSDLSLWGRVDETYARLMGEHRPARAVVPTAPLHYGALLEISAIAAEG
jgi:2-iminobutanoate/2-iminopropanoate deaminase